MSIIDAAINQIKEGQEKGYKPSCVGYINDNGEMVVLEETSYKTCPCGSGEEYFHKKVGCIECC